MKSIVLFDISAIEAWDIGLCAHAVPCDAPDSSECASTAAELAELEGILPRLTRPLHILAPSRDARRQSARWRCHTFKRPLPRNSFFQVEEHVFVAAPYLGFARLARRLPLPEATLLGMEFCGRFSTLRLHAQAGRTAAGKGYLERPPLANAATISRYLAAMGLERHATAVRASKLLQDNARSPREALLHVLLTCRRPHGGYHFTGYAVNSAVALPKHLETLVGSPSLECDFLWEERGLCIEYDGKDYHSDDAQRAHDNMKRLALSQLGIRVVTVDKHQLREQHLIDGVMQAVSEQIGASPVRMDRAAVEARMRLRRRLLDPSLDLYDPPRA